MSCDALTPTSIAALVRSAASPQPTPPPIADERDALLQAARAADESGDIAGGLDVYMDLHELALGEEYEQEVLDRLWKLYPMADKYRDTRNSSDTFRIAMEQRVRNGEAEVVQENPPIYLLHNVVSVEEAANIRSLALRRRARWSRHGPLVCFQHDDFTGLPALASSWEFLNGKPGAGARGCLNQAASAAVADSIPLSDSLFVYRGQEPALDQLSMRIQELTGLFQAHSHPFQLLSYNAGRDGGYSDHTDCESSDRLRQAGTRMATFLLYLSDGFEGGETEFPRIGLKLRPPIGSALLFYNYGPGWHGERCHLDALHRSNPVTSGTKIVLQRWHSYLEQPFLAARPMPAVGASMKRLPFQPVISCDYVMNPTTNVSCRWYNHDEVLEDSGD